MPEIAQSFGTDRHLAGTLSLPSDGQVPRIGVILLNAGVIHRIGPHRFNVKLARAISSLGVATLRMDLSGQGDSGTPAQPLPFEQQAVADLRAAMDHLQRVCNVQRFVIAGICSGAHNGLATALADERVVGLWMLDGYAYATPRTARVRYQHQLSQAPLRTLAGWTRRAIGHATEALSRLASRPGEAMALDDGQRQPAREAFGRDVQALVDRGVALCFVYSGSMFWQFNYAAQLRDAFSDFGFVDHVHCEHLPEVDHTATTLTAQRRLIRSMADWLPVVPA